MKIVIIILTIIVIISLGTLYLSGVFRPGTPASLPSSPTSSPSPFPTLKVLISPFATPGKTGTTPANVSFTLSITGVTGSGLTRTVNVEIANNGTDDAHNVSAKVEVFSAGSRIPVSGKDYLNVNIGMLKAGMILTKQVTVSFGLSDGIKLSGSGADFVITLTSDEITRMFDYHFKP